MYVSNVQPLLVHVRLQLLVTSIHLPSKHGTLALVIGVSHQAQGIEHLFLGSCSESGHDKSWAIMHAFGHFRPIHRHTVNQTITRVVEPSLEPLVFFSLSLSPSTSREHSRQGHARVDHERFFKCIFNTACVLRTLWRSYIRSDLIFRFCTHLMHLGIASCSHPACPSLKGHKQSMYGRRMLNIIHMLVLTCYYQKAHMLFNLQAHPCFMPWPSSQSLIFASFAPSVIFNSQATSIILS